jgi:hypothetical protein
MLRSSAPQARKTALSLPGFSPRTNPAQPLLFPAADSATKRRTARRLRKVLTMQKRESNNYDF